LTNFGKDCYHGGMSTINVSLPKEQVSLVDNLTSVYGFASRSEFIRALLRLISRRPELVETAVTFPFVSPSETSVRKIVSDFKKENKYSKVFLKDLKAGLESSNYFQK